MAIRTRIDPIDRDIELMLNEDLSPAAQSQALARFARDQFDQAQATNEQALGQKPRHETFVDGSRTEQLDQVRPDGTIVFEFEIVLDTLMWIYQTLVQHSPVLAGDYKRSHVLFADGREVDINGQIPPAAEYVFLNTQPYARKIEGVAGRQPQSKQAPDGVYQVVAAMAQRRFGNTAKIAFTYQSTAASVASGEANRLGRAALKKRERDSRQPAIKITVG